MAKKPNLTVVGGAGEKKTGTNLTDEQQQALLLQSLKNIKRLKTEQATATSALRNAYKAAKADGFTKADIDYALGLEKEKEEDAIERRRREFQIARWLNHPIGTQADMFDDIRDDRPLRDRAFDEGKRAGIEGEECKPPFDPGTDGYDGWMEGWHRGQEILADAIKKPADSPLLRSEQNKDAAPDELDKASDKEWPDEQQSAANKKKGGQKEEPGTAEERQPEAVH